jgi:protein-serine/threonine kinase
MRKLLHKDEHKRLGCRAGASDVKAHPFFKSINFALLRHCTPPITPLVQKPNGIDALNFRKMPPESLSFDLESDDVLVTLKADKANPFEKFNSSKSLSPFFFCMAITSFFLMPLLFSYPLS